MKYLENRFRNLLNIRQANREMMEERIKLLQEKALTQYNMSSVVRDVMDKDLGLHPHQSLFVRHSAGEVDVAYEVENSHQVRGLGRKRQPLFKSVAVESQDGEFYDVPDELYTSNRVKRFSLFSLELTEDGEFHLKVPYERPVRLGSTVLIKGKEDLLAAIKDHIKRKKPTILNS